MEVKRWSYKYMQYRLGKFSVNSEGRRDNMLIANKRFLTAFVERSKRLAIYFISVIAMSSVRRHTPPPLVIGGGGVIQGFFAGGLVRPPIGGGIVQVKTMATPGRIGASMALPPSFRLPTGAGAPLPGPVKQRMEAAFRADFSQVRVHVGPEAPAIGAIAFTSGNQIFFAPGHYAPETPRGQLVIGHELTHVVQQRAGRVRNPFGGGLAVVQDAMLEAEADRMGQFAVHARTGSLLVPAQCGHGVAQGAVQAMDGGRFMLAWEVYKKFTEREKENVRYRLWYPEENGREGFPVYAIRNGSNFIEVVKQNKSAVDKNEEDINKILARRDDNDPDYFQLGEKLVRSGASLRVFKAVYFGNARIWKCNFIRVRCEERFQHQECINNK